MYKEAKEVSMSEKTKIALISSLFTLLISVVPGFMVFGATYKQVGENEKDIKELTQAVAELKEIAAAQRELNRLLQRYFEQKTR